jgi:cobalamin biosynthesis protein CbiG
MNSGNKSEHRPVIFYITDNSFKLARRLLALFPDADIVKFDMAVFEDKWNNTGKIICIMAAGIVVRSAASLLKDKKTDPAVVVMDEKGEYAISLLSGHIGGANALARRIAEYLDAQAVITTASDVQGKIALDLWAEEENLYVEDREKLKRLSSKIVNGQTIKVCSEHAMGVEHIPEEFEMVETPDRAEMIITDRLLSEDALILRPRTLFVGIGCNRGTAMEEIREAVDAAFQKERLSPCSINRVASIDIKKDEQGLLDFARGNGLKIEFFSKDELNRTALSHNMTESETVRAATGAVAVAEPAAILASERLIRKSVLVMPKLKRGNVTLAIAKAESML